MISPRFALLAASLLVGVPLAAAAQTQPFAAPGAAPMAPAPTAPPPFAPALPPATQAAPAAPQSQVQAAAEQRINGLQTQLAITAAQAPQWTAFAQVMRENAQATDTLFRQRAAGAQSMNATANMQSYAQISRAYADGTERLSAAFQSLYAILSDPQKQAADTLFRQQAAQATTAPAVRR